MSAVTVAHFGGCAYAHPGHKRAVASGVWLLCTRCYGMNQSHGWAQRAVPPPSHDPPRPWRPYLEAYVQRFSGQGLVFDELLEKVCGLLHAPDCTCCSAPFSATVGGRRLVGIYLDKCCLMFKS